MLGCVVTPDGHARARLLRGLVARLGSEGWRLAGAIDLPAPVRAGVRLRRQMLLSVLGAEPSEIVDIAQDLGPLARGCKLDPGALERVAGLAEAALGRGADLVIVNKFGKREAEGRGFRPLIGQALAAGVPVLVGLAPARRAEFDAFAAGMAEEVAPRAAALRAWASAHRAALADP
jgi:hypothetical protein